MNITSKTLTTTTSKSFVISTLNDVHVAYDDPIRKELRVSLTEAVPPQYVSFRASEYDALGQWTDTSLNEALIAKYELEVIV